MTKVKKGYMDYSLEVAQAKKEFVARKGGDGTFDQLVFLYYEAPELFSKKEAELLDGGVDLFADQTSDNFNNDYENQAYNAIVNALLGIYKNKDGVEFSSEGFIRVNGKPALMLDVLDGMVVVVLDRDEPKYKKAKSLVLTKEGAGLVYAALDGAYAPVISKKHILAVR